MNQFPILRCQFVINLLLTFPFPNTISNYLHTHHFRFSNLTSETRCCSLRRITDSKPQLVFPSEGYAQFAMGSASGCKSLVWTTFRSRTTMSAADSSIDWCPYSRQRTWWLILRARASTRAVRTLSSSAIASTNSLSANLQTNCGQSDPTHQLPMLAINPTIAIRRPLPATMRIRSEKGTLKQSLLKPNQ
jgi:hypothetical protein